MGEEKSTFFLNGEPVVIHRYDPQKAHDYYVRTRHLKGRHGGSGHPLSSGRQGGGNQHHPPKKSAKELQKEAHARVAALEKRLERLREVLRELVKQSKARAGVETKNTPTKKAAASGGGSKGHDKPLTAAQKRDAAKRSEEYRKKHPEHKSDDKKAKEVEAKIKDVREQIRKIRAELQAASQRGRAHMQTQTAPKGR